MILRSSLLALCILSAAAWADPPTICAPIEIPPSTAPESERIEWAHRLNWTAWDIAAGHWVGERRRGFPDIDPARWLAAPPAGYVMLFNEPGSAPPADANGSRHLVLEAPIETWLMADAAAGRAGAVRTDTGEADAHLGCIVPRQAWGWRPTPEVYAAIQGIQTAADRDCAGTVTTTTLAGRTDFERICAQASGQSAAIDVVGQAFPVPPGREASRWCAIWTTACSMPNETRAAQLRANADAARAGAVDPLTGAPTQVADWALGWRTAVPAQ